MTFIIPETLVAQLIKRVPASERSQYVTKAILERLEKREQRLIRACDAANADDDVRRIEREFDTLPDTMRDE